MFKNGKAEKVWINLESIEGPADVKSTISDRRQARGHDRRFPWADDQAINKFMYQQCAKRYGPGAVAQDPDKKKADAAKKLAAKKSADSGRRQTRSRRCKRRWRRAGREASPLPPAKPAAEAAPKAP